MKTETKLEAVKVASSIVKNQHSELTIAGGNGKNIFVFLQLSFPPNTTP
ncbi:MAG: hypothetical protein ABIN67_14190 [Ferruginibacter sp.]